MKFNTKTVVVNNKSRIRYYINGQRCTEEQYSSAKSKSEISGENFAAELICKIKECSMDWATLKDTGIEGIKFCQFCNERVHMCHSWTEVDQCRRRGMCVAIRHPWSYPHVTLGVPSY